MHEFVCGMYKLLNTFIMWLPFYYVRLLWCKIILKKVGKNVYFSRNIDFKYPRNISIGNNVVINKKCMLDGRGYSINIGDNVDIAQETNIWTLEHNPNSKQHLCKGGDVKIEDYVWIASRATILPDITLGEGVVVASGAVVTHTPPPYSCVGGVPAKVISKREKPDFTLKYKPFFE